MLNYKDTHSFLVPHTTSFELLIFRSLGNSLGLNLASGFSIKKNLSSLNNVAVSSGACLEHRESLRSTVDSVSAHTTE